MPRSLFLLITILEALSAPVHVGLRNLQSATPPSLTIPRTPYHGLASTPGSPAHCSTPKSLAIRQHSQESFFFSASPAVSSPFLHGVVRSHSLFFVSFSLWGVEWGRGKGGGALHVTAFALGCVAVRLAFLPLVGSLLSTFSGLCFSDVWICVSMLGRKGRGFLA